MSRKNLLLNFRALVGGDMSSATLNSTETNVQQFDTVTYKVDWSGGQATNGDLTIEYSDDGITWRALDFGATPNTNGASGNHSFIITEIGFKLLRCTYTRTNALASGSMNVTVFSTNKGG